VSAKRLIIDAVDVSYWAVREEDLSIRLSTSSLISFATSTDFAKERRNRHRPSATRVGAGDSPSDRRDDPQMFTSDFKLSRRMYRNAAFVLLQEIQTIEPNDLSTI